MEAISTALKVTLDDLIGENDEQTQRKIKMAETIDKLESNPLYQRLTEEEAVLESLYKKAKFKKDIEKKVLDEIQLDNLLGGKLDRTYNEKVDMIEIQLDNQIKNDIETLENFYNKYLDTNYAIRFKK